MMISILQWLILQARCFQIPLIQQTCIILTKMQKCLMNICITKCIDLHYMEHLYVKCFSGERDKKKKKPTWGQASNCNISLHALIFILTIIT